MYLPCISTRHRSSAGVSHRAEPTSAGYLPTRATTSAGYHPTRRTTTGRAWRWTSSCSRYISPISPLYLPCISPGAGRVPARGTITLTLTPTLTLAQGLLGHLHPNPHLNPHPSPGLARPPSRGRAGFAVEAEHQAAHQLGRAAAAGAARAARQLRRRRPAAVHEQQRTAASSSEPR